MILLAIESSFDECSVAVVQSEGFRLKENFSVQVLSCETLLKLELYRPFCGVVPEIAARSQLEYIIPLIQQALQTAGVGSEQIDAVAVTQKPGLIGSLLVGVSAAKALAYSWDKPLVPVHHIEGHIASIFLENREPIPFPLMLCMASGGHTQILHLQEGPQSWPADLLQSWTLGTSRDDAAGEAYDKCAKTLGLPYPGGKEIEDLAKTGNPDRFSFPIGLRAADSFDFSFSGVKTAFIQTYQKLRNSPEWDESWRADLAASIQKAINSALALKLALALKSYPSESIAIVGGVAANFDLRTRLEHELKVFRISKSLIAPPLKYCTDNAAMIGAAGCIRFEQGRFVKGESLLKLTALAS